MRLTTKDQSYAAGADYLREHPEAIKEAWNNPYGERGGSLFLPCTPYDKAPYCACLTQLKELLGRPGRLSREKCGLIPGLSIETAVRLGESLMQDDRIPISSAGITRDSLQGFVEWQERLDAEFAAAASE